MRFIILILLMLVFSGINTYSQSSITSPLDRSVYQRGSDNNATIWLSGQIFTPTKPTKIQFRTVKLNISGVDTDNPTFTDIPAGNIQLGRIYRHSTVKSAGWYRLEVRGLDNSSNVLTSYNVKFGVGEVFIVAGQSNAHGAYSDNVNQAIVNPPNGFVYDCISITDYNAGNCNSQTLGFPFFTNLYPEGNIGPYGDGIWAYGRFAKRIVEDKQVPVMIFNTAQNGTWIDNWQQSANGLPGNSWICGSTLFPYLGLKNALNLYASTYGIRAIIWHQGEQDTYFNTVSSTEYKNDLKAVIAATRSDLDNQVIPWVISKASFITTKDAYGNITFQNSSANVTNGQQGAISETSAATWGATDQDNIRNVNYTLNGVPGSKSNRQGDGTHFSDAGLLDLADDYYAKINSILALTPIKGKDLGNIQVQALSSSSWRLTSSATGASTYRWSTGSCPYDSPCNTSSSVSIDKSDGWWNCYIRNAKGNFIFTPRVSLPLPANGARIASTNLIPVKIYPNPILQGSEIKIEFELIEDSNNFTLSLINSRGKLLKTITNLPHGKGKYFYNISASSLNQQEVIYLRLASDGYGQTDRLYIH